MIIEYNEQTVFTEALDIVDIGNVALRASNSSGIEYYIITKTNLGKTGILEFGPILPDFPSLLDGFHINYQKIDYKESKIMKSLNSFVNDYKRAITKVEELTDIEALNNIPDIVNGFVNM